MWVSLGGALLLPPGRVSSLSPAGSFSLALLPTPQNVLSEPLNPSKSHPSSSLEVHLTFNFLSRFYSLGENSPFPCILLLFNTLPALL